MNGNDEARLVTRAQLGDVEAFARLVNRYQDLVAGTAYGWLGDSEAARDVAQEVFLDAHLKLAQLRDPAAFGGWLKRIVVKHCDRITRRRNPVTASLEEVAEPISANPGPEGASEVIETAEGLRFAVESLPLPERQVVALHYFADVTGPELAAFLELPLSTVKKRLRSARSRLRLEGDRLMKETMERLRPSRTGGLTLEVSFFIALRAGDHDSVRHMLAETPALVEARQEWDPALVFDGLLPFANRATALITAIEQDDADMLELLLEAGADPNGDCGCATGESPLWAAVLLNREQHARALLERGADPNRASAAGNLPLHLAAMRGRAALVEVLLEHGADPGRLDTGARYVRPLTPLSEATSGGRSAADWARTNGHGPVAERLDRAADTSAHSRLSEKIALERIGRDRLHTGIKALDLLAPLNRGGLVRFPFRAGVGMVVLLGELCRRFCAAEKGAAIWTGFAQPPFDIKDWAAEMAEFGLLETVHNGLVSFRESPGERRAAFEHGIERGEALRDAGADVLAVVLSSAGFEGDVEANLLRLTAPRPTGSITTIVVTSFPGTDEVWTSLEAPYTGQIVLDRNRANRYLFPALDPETSLSVLNNGSRSGRHNRLADRVRSRLADYLVHDPTLAGLDEAAEALEPGDAQTIRLLRYLCQPFFVTEPFTGRAGEWVGERQLLDEVESLLAG